MNKELEEFKELILDQLNGAIAAAKTTTCEKWLIGDLEDIAIKLKPKLEFIEGEIVKAHFNGSPVLVGFNTEFDNDTGSYPARTANLGSCKKIDFLPMHMTDHDGTDKYPDNVGHETLVYIITKRGIYNGGVASVFHWTNVAKFQILKDLNP